MGKEKEEEQTDESLDKELNIVDRAEAANKELKENLAKQEELITRQERLNADEKLKGTAEAGSAPPEKKEDTDEDYANKVMANDIDTK